MSCTFPKHVIVSFLFLLVQILLLQSANASLFDRKQDKKDVSYIMRITKLQCIDAPYKRSHLNYCKMVQFPNGTVALNTSVTIPTLMNYGEIVAKLFYKYTTYRPFMIDWTVEYCQAARKTNLSPTAAIMMKIAESSVPEYYYPCPHGNRTYATYWTFESRYIPMTLPSGDYRLDICFRDSQRITLYALQMFASIRKQGIIG